MKTLKKVFFSMLITALLLSNFPYSVGVHASETNIALNKPVTTSSVRPARSELVGALAVDGIDDDESSRWSSKMATGLGENEGPSEDGTVEQWITVDLKNMYDLSMVYISWEGAYAKSYQIQTSLDGTDFTDIYVNTNAKGGKQTIDKTSFINPALAKYVRIKCNEPVKASWGYSIYEIKINGTQKDNENLALSKDVSYSGVEGGKVSDSWKYPQFVGEKVVDGDSTTRWSADKADNQWIIVDLKEVEVLSQINVNFFREPLEYTVEISKDGSEYTTILDVKDNPMINIENIREIVFDSQETRYIKVNQTKMFTNPSNGNKYGGSIFEIEAYKYAMIEPEIESAKMALTKLESEGFELPESSNKKIVFPESITKNFDVEIYGSDYKSIIDLDGVYHQPLVDKDVHIMYKIINKNDENDIAISSNDNRIHVYGKYENSGENEFPNVIPTIQEWHGEDGDYSILDTSKIVYNDASLEVQANILSGYLNKLVGIEIDIEKGTNPEKGDIYLSLTNNDKAAVLGNEGYIMTVGDYVTINSTTVKGVFYGGVSIVQALYLNSDELEIPKGIAYDYPKYEVRSIALDVARSEIKLDYIKEITEMLPLFKVNEIVMHINDDRGDKIADTTIGSEQNIKQTKDLSAFRIENDKNIGGHAYQISKADYIEYQLEAAKYGVSVVTELDTPAHSAVFSLLPEMHDNMYDVRHLKILDDASTDVNNASLHQPTIDFIDELTQELIGDAPGDAVIQTPIFHFGTDEYKATPIYSEAMQQYINHYTKYVQDRGYEARAWASSDGSSGFKGYVTPQNKEVTYYLWAPYWSDVKKTVANGNPIINCSGSWLYIVPGGNNGYSNYLNMEKLYNEWSVNNITTTRGSGGAVLPISHPQLKGASVVLWNDDGFLLDGVSDFDIFERLKYGIAIIGERTWYGEKTEEQSYDDFKTAYEYLLKTGPSATSNPARYVPSKSESVVDIDFETINDNKAIDNSGNGYNGVFNSTTAKGISGNSLVLNEDSYLQMPFDSIGFPASVSFDIYIDKDTPKEATLFEGKDGKINLNQKNKAGEYTDKLGYERDGYTYIFDYRVETEKWLKIMITADKNGTNLYVNDKLIGVGRRTEFGTYVTKNLSTSMILPTEKIGYGIIGKLDNFKIVNECVKVPGPENIACTATNAVASNVYSDSFTGIKAIDKSLTTRWATTNDITSATLELTFDEEVSVNQTRIVEYKAANNYITSYNIEYWDGQNWVVGSSHNVDNSEKTVVAGVTNGYEFSSNFDIITASKIRLNITNASRPSIFEFELFYNENEVITVDKGELEKVINDANECNQDNYTVTTYNSMVEILKYAKEIFNTDYITQLQIDEASNALSEALNSLLERADITEAQALLENYKDLNSQSYSEASWQAFAKAKQNVSDAIKDTSELLQEQLDELCNKLVKAYKALETSINNKHALAIAIEMAESASLENVVPVVIEEFNAALANAREVYANSTNQNEIDEAFDRLASVMHMLEFYKGNKELLQKQVDQINELESDKYIESSWNAMLPVLEKANEVLGNENAMQEEVDEVYSELVRAFVNLRLKPNKDILSGLINKVNGLNRANYTSASLKLVDIEVEKTSTVLNNPEVTKEEVEAAIVDLTKALARLEAKLVETVKTGDTKASIKTGDNGLMTVFAGLSMLSLAGLSLLRKKED